jgi:hypothetical protein
MNYVVLSNDGDYRLSVAFVQDQVGGALSCAAVPQGEHSPRASRAEHSRAAVQSKRPGVQTHRHISHSRKVTKLGQAS